MLDKLRDAYASEMTNFFLWLPVFLAVGIIIFFSLPFDPSVFILLFAILLLFLVLALVVRYPSFAYIGLAVIFILIGFIAAVVRTEFIKAPILNEKLERIWLEGEVTDIAHTEDGQKLILEKLYIKYYEGDLPKKVRLSVKHSDTKITIGNRIGVPAVLMPPPEPSIPKGFDYQQYAYFKQIGAIGYAVGKVRILASDNNLSNYKAFFAYLRQKIEDRIFSQMPKPSSAIAVGILVGDASAIAKEDFDDIRKAGLAHIIAISGMHIVVVVGLIFISTRFILSRSERLLLRFDVKKTSAITAMLGSLVYLLIAGSPLSAQRAFVMSTLVLTAILLDRNANPMRSIAITALIILVTTPEAILSASLQMSMAASMALVASFSFSKNYFTFGNQSLAFFKITKYCLTVVTSTLVAGIATSPFIIYHFNQFSTYSVLSNFIAIPLADFVIMPAGMIAMLLMPLSLEKIALLPMQWGIDFMLYISHLVASLPHASYYVPSLTSLGLVLTSLGGVIICFFVTRLRFIGMVPVIIGMAGILQYVKPDVIISADGRLFAVQDKIGTLAFSSKMKSRFSRNIWQQATGENLIFSISDAYLDGCGESLCKYEKNSHTVIIVASPHIPGNYCNGYDVFINLVDDNFHCEKAKLSINLNNLNENGAYILRLGKPKIEVEKTSDYRTKRIWNQKYDEF